MVIFTEGKAVGGVVVAAFSEGDEVGGGDEGDIVARVDFMENQGGEVAFVRIPNLRQFFRKHRQPRETQPLPEPFRMGNFVHREKLNGFRDQSDGFRGNAPCASGAAGSRSR